MSYHIYGLKNCNTTQKAIQWFKQHKLAYKFINNRTEPISKSKLELWCNQVSWEKLLNKKGTAFKLLQHMYFYELYYRNRKSKNKI